MFFLIFSSLRYDADAGFETIDGETSQESMCVLRMSQEKPIEPEKRKGSWTNTYKGNG